jgi:serine protease Do
VTSRPWIWLSLLFCLFLVTGCGSCKKSDAGADAAPSASAPATGPGAGVIPPTPGVPTSQPAPSMMPGGTPLSFAALAKAVDPGVVTILSRVEKEFRSGRRRVLSEGLGTGFVYDKAGFVLTNNHVVEGATVVQVQFADGRSIAAEVKGRDRHTDVAVLKVTDAGAFHALELGDSDAIDVGDWVVAIGNPFGLSHTVSAGILSGKGRTKDDVKGLDPSGYFNFLQTDAAINQGNSGGPLLNLRGEVVGINTAIRANANNIGFAIPINMVKELLPILVRDGKITRSALGISVRELDPAEAERLKRPDTKGAWVVDVAPGSGADRGGIRPDDVVIEFDGKPVADPNALRWWASIAGVGKTVKVRIARGTRTFELRIVLGELPEAPAPPSGHGSIPGFPPGFP